jgi:hypothetical protein
MQEVSGSRGARPEFSWQSPSSRELKAAGTQSTLGQKGVEFGAKFCYNRKKQYVFRSASTFPNGVFKILLA